MSTSASTTLRTKNDAEKRSTPAKIEETQLVAYKVLSETFGMGEDLPENLLLGSAQRLTNLVHSLFEHREKEYMSDSQDMAPSFSELTVENICKLTEAANSTMKTALEFKKERARALRTIAEAVRVLR